MKALTFKRYGRSPEIEFADVPRPTLKTDELLVQVHAAGLNPIDNMIPAGTFKPVLKFELPATLGSDIAGVVVEVGSRVTRFKPGDAVFASLFDLGRGAIAEFAAVPESVAAPKPAKLDFVQAASVPMVGLTSWQALKERAKVQAGQKVFIPAGSGGIGTFAIQLAKYLGAKVGTTTSTGNVPLVTTLGAERWLIIRRRTSKKCCGATTWCSVHCGAMRSRKPRHSQAREQDCLAHRSVGRRLRPRTSSEFLFHVRVRLDEPKNQPPCKKAGRHLLVSIHASRRRPTRPNWRASRVGTHSSRDRQGFFVRASEGSA